VLFTGFGFTRDRDHVRLELSPTGVSHLQTLCGDAVDGDHIVGTIRTETLQEAFVIFDFKKQDSNHPMKCEDSVDIPRADVLGVKELTSDQCKTAAPFPTLRQIAPRDAKTGRARTRSLVR
jgi:hypothetical protein